MRGGQVRLWLPAFALAATTLVGCGYHVAGRADRLPRYIQTIAIPAFANATSRHRLTEWLPAALAREFLSRTRYQIVSDPNQADAVLRGAILNYVSYPTVFDPATGRAAGVQLSVTLQITLTDRKSGAVLFSRPYFEVRERYEIAVDERAYFDESQTALERLCRDAARSIVSAIRENF